MTALRPVVAVALVDRAGRVLVQRRPAGKQHAGLWEFPGGKVEPGETLAAAAVREIDEELGVVLHAASLEPVSFAESGGAGGGIVLMLFMARAWRGVPECRDADALAWVAPGRWPIWRCRRWIFPCRRRWYGGSKPDRSEKMKKVTFRRLPTRNDAPRGAPPTHP